MKLGEGVEAATHCATLLAGLEGGATVPAAALAARFGLSASYLLKHLQALAGRGVLESLPGPAGGYRLARPADQVTLLDIVLAIEGPEPAFRCRDIRRKGCVRLPDAAYARPCAIDAAMQRAEAAWRGALAATSLADLQAEFRRDAHPQAVRVNRDFLQTHSRPQRDPQPRAEAGGKPQGQGS